MLEMMHVTLRFLGEINASQKDNLIRCLSDNLQHHRRLRITLTGPQLFPRTSNPRAIACVVKPHPSLASLAGAVEACAQVVGLPPERKPFTGHITLGRTRDSFPKLSSLPVTVDDVDNSDIGMTVDVVALYKSDLMPTGARYTRLATFTLREPEPD
jgi:2'-5' RNA ligase